MPLSPRVPELSALDVLLSVARLGSLGKAAIEHGISQPAVGSRIRYMERLLGMPLIERSSQGCRLTREGALIVNWARDVVAAASSLDLAVNALRTRRGKHLHIAASMTVAEYLFPTWLATLHHESPTLTVSLSLNNSTEVASQVLEGNTELGFVEGPAVADGLRDKIVARDRLEVVVSPAHPWARRRKPIGKEEIASTPLIQREPGSGTRSTLERVLGPQYPIAEPLIELSSTTAVKAAVATGIAPAVISSLAIADDLADRRLVAVPVVGLDLQRNLRAIWLNGRRVLGPARDFLALASRRPG
jgi:DNA-binding transcriptional LysR family regulator